MDLNKIERFSKVSLLVLLYEGTPDGGAQLARSLFKEMDLPWVVFEENGVEPTNNRADRALKLGVIYGVSAAMESRVTNETDESNVLCKSKRDGE